jgi:hypothetical protein
LNGLGDCVRHNEGEEERECSTAESKKKAKKTLKSFSVFVVGEGKQIYDDLDWTFCALISNPSSPFVIASFQLCRFCFDFPAPPRRREQRRILIKFNRKLKTV